MGGAFSDRVRSDLFVFDTELLQRDILLREGVSEVDYHEYAVFAVTRETGEPTASHADGHQEASYSVRSSKELPGAVLLNLAVREKHAIDSEGHFQPQEDIVDPTLEGRVRQVICRRRVHFASSEEDGTLDGLSLVDQDFQDLGLHPATLQYIRRITAESMFWDRRHEKLSLILSFSAAPRALYDFLSLTHNIPDRTTTILIRQSEPLEHESHTPAEEVSAKYTARMAACRAHWAHPLVTPVVLMQVQLQRTETAMADNAAEVTLVEQDVGNLAGFDAYERQRPNSRRSWSASTERRLPKKSTELMKNAHDVLKRSIRLLDTVRWMERAVTILIDTGNALGDVKNDEDSATDQASPLPLSFAGRAGTNLSRARIVDDPMSGHWHEIRQYLEGLLQLCHSLTTDRQMLELRCKAQIDIIYAKLAQEDNNLNARMAVASTRDSSSMKALAVITAIFLPGEFIGTLFGMSMFDWGDVQAGNGGSGDSSVGNKHPIVTSRFWVYWALSIPLTIFILATWRGWWVVQDRHFRKHLSKELSEERFWTEDNRPRHLRHSFFHDFFYLSVRRDERGSRDEGAMLSSEPTMPRPATVDEKEKYVMGNGTLPASVQPAAQEAALKPEISRPRRIAFAGVSPPGTQRNGTE